MGGIFKNKNFKPMYKLRDKIKKIYLIGESTDYIYNQLINVFSCEKCLTMNNAVKISRINVKNAQYSTILLAPACSSFDQYTNFEDRGNDFIKKVKKYFNNIS